MTNEPGQDAKTIRPLWIVANLLLTVAVCLLLLVIKNRLSHSHEDSHGNSATPVIVAEDQATRTKDHDVTRGFWSTTRRTSGIQRVSEASQPSGDAGKTALQTPPPPPEGISHSVWGGVIAPVIASASTNFTTAIVGRVTLRGEPPPEVPIDMSASPPCARLQTNSSTTRNFVVSPDGGLADVFVSIVSGLSGKSYTPP